MIDNAKGNINRMSTSTYVKLFLNDDKHILDKSMCDLTSPLITRIGVVSDFGNKPKDQLCQVVDFLLGT